MYYFFISGKQKCYSGWKAEYTGFLMTEYKNFNGKDYVCMDKDAEPIDSDSSSMHNMFKYECYTTIKTTVWK
jgi:hypothetical protein